MITRRQIRTRVMQAIYAWYTSGYTPSETYDHNLGPFAQEIRDNERQKGEEGDFRLLTTLYYDTIERKDEFDVLIQSKAENWELERMALIDRILMEMGLCEMLTFEEIPIKVTINEYLEIAKKYSTPKSSKFINGILDSLYTQFKTTGEIKKSGRGLVEESTRRQRPAPGSNGPRFGPRPNPDPRPNPVPRPNPGPEPDKGPELDPESGPNPGPGANPESGPKPGPEPDSDPQKPKRRRIKRTPPPNFNEDSRQ